MANYWQLEDAELVGLIRGGDQQAFSMLYARYGTILFRHAQRMLKDEEASRDTLQDVFAALWEKRETLNINHSASGYLYTMMRHAVLRRLREGKQADNFLQQLSQFSEVEGTAVDAALREEELRELIEKEISRLPGKMREVFLLSRRDHLSHREIAERLGLSEFTVKRQTSNALAILRKRLGYLYALAMTML